MKSALSLVVRRSIRATPERLFDAWTRPEQLTQWWGPSGVTCPHAEVDLRTGGSYRITNVMPNGETVDIVGEFQLVDRPRKLIYTWQIGSSDNEPELVTVLFTARGAETEVCIVHERIATPASREGHAAGWAGCLDGLAAYVGG
jgi:uncharacterized protein YndB with AHSA1/START domain